MTQANNVAIESSQINSSGVLQPAGGGTGVTTTTGSGSAVLNSSPTLVTPTVNTITSASSTALTLQTNNGTTAVTIDTSQNVGIGTTSPSYKLDVNGSSRVGGGNNFYATGNSYFGSSTGGYSVFLNSTANWNYDEFIIQRNASNTSNVRFMGFYLDGDTAGNTNFGAYPGFQVSYSSSPTTGSTSIGLSASLNISTVSTMTFSRNVSGTNTESMRLDSSGNLLVGTTSTSGSSSNNALSVSGIFNSLNGTTGSLSNGSSADIVTSTANTSFYQVFANCVGNTTVFASALIYFNGAGTATTVSITATGMTIGSSGANKITVTNAAGSSQQISWTVVRYK